MKNLPNLSIEKGKRIKRTVFTEIFQKELSNALGTKISKKDTRIIEELYSKSLGQVLTFGSYMDPYLNLYYRRVISNTQVRSAPITKHSSLIMSKPEIKVNHTFTDKEKFVISGTDNGDGTFTDLDGNTFNIEEYEKELRNNNYYLDESISAEGITVYLHELEDELDEEDLIYVTKGYDDEDYQNTLTNTATESVIRHLEKLLKPKNDKNDKVEVTDDKEEEDKPKKKPVVKKPKKKKVIEKPEPEEDNEDLDDEEDIDDIGLDEDDYHDDEDVEDNEDLDDEVEEDEYDDEDLDDEEDVEDNDENVTTKKIIKKPIVPTIKKIKVVRDKKSPLK